MMSEELLAYCVKCKTKRPLANPEPVFTKKGQPATRGQCPECGTALFRMGETAAHAGMTRPDPAPRSKAKASAKVENGRRRRGKLVIVESPAKARTIENYLGKDYRVRASIGHVRDLLKSQLSVDVENDFEPTYRIPNDKRDVVKDLKAAAAGAAEIYLATDPDREGEAIAWHLVEAADIESERVRRVAFYEITRDAIREAFETPRSIDLDLVNAQQARRILDRLVGYELSPLLWDKVRPRLSAGRVQSVAVRMAVEREREIQNFVPEEYWTIDAELARNVEHSDPQRIQFLASLRRVHEERIELPTQDTVGPIVADLENAEYIVTGVKRGTRKRAPQPPFTTSTLQQEASRRLNFNTRRTMQIAQELYEGINLGEQGEIGLITYMRTDSTHVAEPAQKEAMAFIQENFGKEYAPGKPNIYTARAKGAQEAHEAIRPTGVVRTPDNLAPFLSKDQLRLYRLIWSRFVASQMAEAIYDTLRVDIQAGDAAVPVNERPYTLRSTGSTLRFPGFLAVYADQYDEDNPQDEDLDRIFPDLTDGDLLDLIQLLPEQHFTQPPSRYTEASLVKALEEFGVGRPSTYAPIMQTIQQRGYVERDSKRLVPTDTGMVVNDLLVQYFPEVVDLNFTARMEDDLDLIASGEKEWIPVLREFYNPFKQDLQTAFDEAPSVDLGNEEVGRECPRCGKPLVIRWGRFGKFIGCSDFPTCRHTEPWLEKIGVICPDCGSELVERKTRKGRTFYGCSNYPTCQWTSWKRPLPTPCPVCEGLLIMQSKQLARCQNCHEQVPIEASEEEQTESV